MALRKKVLIFLQKTPGISIAVEFDGKGRETDNINGATGLGLIDIDGLDRK